MTFLSENGAGSHVSRLTRLKRLDSIPYKAVMDIARSHNVNVSTIPRLPA